MLIGITGRAGAGQDAVADYLVQAHSFMATTFDSPLRRMLQACFGITEAQFGSALRDEVIPALKRSPAQLLHSLRWSWIRVAVEPDTLIPLCADAIGELQGFDIVIPDVWTQEEANFITKCGGTVLQIISPHGVGQKPSITLQATDRELHYHTSLHRLYDQVDAIVGEESFLGAVS